MSNLPIQQYLNTPRRPKEEQQRLLNTKLPTPLKNEKTSAWTPNELLKEASQDHKKDFNSLDPYTLVFHVNQPDWVIRIWITKDGGKVDFPKRHLEFDKHEKWTVGRWGWEAVGDTALGWRQIFEMEVSTLSIDGDIDKPGASLEGVAKFRAVDPMEVLTLGKLDRGEWASESDVRRMRGEDFKVPAVKEQVLRGFEMLEKVAKGQSF